MRHRLPHLIEEVYLRGADLIHLASAIALKKRISSIILLASDNILLNAAEKVGLDTLDPTK